MVTEPDPPLDPDAATPELLRHTAELAARFREGLPERRVGPDRDGQRRRPAGRPRRPAAQDRPRCPDRRRRARRGGRPGAPGDGRTALLRVRHRRGRAGRAGHRLARRRRGTRTSACSSTRRRRRSSRRWPAGWLLELLGLPAGRIGRVHDRRDDGQRHGPRRRAPRGPAPRRLGRRGGGPAGRAADQGRRRRRTSTPRCCWPCATSGWVAVGPSGSPPTTRAGWTRARWPRPCAGRRPDHRRRPARRGEHRGVRPDRAHRGGRPRAPERVAPRRRGVRAVGGGQPARCARSSTATTPRTRGRPTPTSG